LQRFVFNMTTIFSPWWF